MNRGALENNIGYLHVYVKEAINLFLSLVRSDGRKMLFCRKIQHVKRITSMAHLVKEAGRRGAEEEYGWKTGAAGSTNTSMMDHC